VHKSGGKHANKVNLIDTYGRLVKNYVAYQRATDIARRQRFREKITRIEQEVENIAKKLSC
jgi:hypothetical protein